MLVSHSTAVSHRRLLQWKENSTALAHHSYRLPTAVQLVEEFRDQIASHRRTISRRGSNVINRLDRSSCHFSGQLHDFWPDRLSLRDPFHLRQPKWNRRDAAERNANIVNHTSSRAAAKPSQRRDAHFRNSLSLARSYFPRIMKIARKPSPQADGSNQLIGCEVHLLVAGVEAEVRHAALAASRH